MKRARKTLTACWAAGIGMIIGVGCQTLLPFKKMATPPTHVLPGGATQPVVGNKPFPTYHIQVNDTLMIFLRGITPEQPQLELMVDENGDVKLPYINTIKAEGSTASELEDAIRRSYLSHKIYKNITVNVIIPAQTTPAPSFYIKGEVHSPGRIPYVNGMTVLTAVAAAGGPNDYFSPSMVLLRGTQKIKINYYDLEKHPDQDIPIQAGDIIIVDKSWF